MPSDIFIKTASSTWSKATGIFIKTASATWSSAKAVWMFIDANWLKIWPLSGIFSNTSPYIATTSASTTAISHPTRLRIGTTYYGKNGTWNANGWTITGYDYKWIVFQNQDDAFEAASNVTTYTSYTAPVAQSFSTTSIASAVDGKWVSFQVRANASGGTAYDGEDFSGNGGNKLQVVRQQPRLATGGSPILNKYNPTVGDVLSYSSSWDITEPYKPDATRSSIVWYKNSTSSTSGGTIIQNNNSYSYTVQSSDLGFYIYAIETVRNTGSDYDFGYNVGVTASVITSSTVGDINYQTTGSQRRVNLPSAFNTGTTIYVSTNGYINWGGTDPGGSIGIPTSGITLAPLQADLRQGSTVSSANTSIGGLWTYGDSTNYWVTWWGNYYSDGTQYARYQVKFYWGQSYADVYIVNNTLSSAIPSTTAVQNGANVYNTWSQSSSQTSTLLSTSTMNRISTGGLSNVGTNADGTDDNRTVIVAAQPTAPSGGSASISGLGTPSTYLTLSRVDATGNPAPSVTWVWRRADGGVGGNSFTGGTTLQSGGDQYLVQSSDVGYAVRAEVTWSNGVLPNQLVNTNGITITSGQYTVTWNATANGGTGGGSTTQNAGVSHTAPSASKAAYVISYSSTGQTSGSVPSSTQSYFVVNGYYDTTSLSYTFGPIAIGGSFNPPYSITMYARYSTSSQSVTLSGQGTLLRNGYTFAGWSIGGTTYAAGSSYTPTANVTATAVWTQNVSVPSGGTVSISTNTGNYSVGSIITYSTTGWANSPTSYYLELHNGTNPVLTSDPLRASTTSTSGTYTISSSDVPNYFKAWATATNSAGSATASSSQVGPAYTPVSAPTNTSVPTLSGGLAVNSSFTFGVGSWSGSPTSYDLRLYRGTQFVSSGETLIKSAGNVTSSSYTITQADYDSGQRYFRTYASATNSGGSSGLVAGQELGPITTGGGGGGSAPVLVSLTGNNSLAVGGTFTWSFTNSPTGYSVYCSGPDGGTVYTTSNQYTYTGTSFRPGYDGTGWRGAGNYTISIVAQNASGTSSVASLTTYMS